MGTVNDWAGAIGGTILGIELILLVLVLVLLNAGLAFGLWWVLKKMGWVHEKVTWATGLLEKVVDRSANIVAAPVIRTTSFWRGLKAGVYRATHWPKRAAVPAPGAQQPRAKETETAARAA
jgi:hypothetical protein